MEVDPNVINAIIDLAEPVATPVPVPVVVLAPATPAPVAAPVAAPVDDLEAMDKDLVWNRHKRALVERLMAEWTLELSNARPEFRIVAKDNLEFYKTKLASIDARITLMKTPVTTPAKFVSPKFIISPVYSSSDWADLEQPTEQLIVQAAESPSKSGWAAVASKHTVATPLEILKRPVPVLAKPAPVPKFGRKQPSVRGGRDHKGIDYCDFRDKDNNYKCCNKPLKITQAMAEAEGIEFFSFCTKDHLPKRR
jgi:hypothetical protein